ncbi:MAG: hypothetical protein AAF358_14125 [Pseudomonadota bacterium]
MMEWLAYVEDIPIVGRWLGVVVFAVLFVPKLLEMRHAFGELRTGAKNRNAVKDELEILKLRYEVAELRQRANDQAFNPFAESQLPTRLGDTSGKSTTSYSGLEEREEVSKPAPLSNSVNQPWAMLRWLQDRSNGLARALIAVPAAIAFFVSVFLFLGSIMFFVDTKGGSLSGGLFGLCLGFVTWLVFSVLRKQDDKLLLRKELLDDRQ